MQTVLFIRPRARTSRLKENARAKRHGRPFLCFRLSISPDRPLGERWSISSNLKLRPARVLIYASPGRAPAKDNRESLSVSAMSRLSASLATPGMAHARIDLIAQEQPEPGPRRKGGGETLRALLLDLDERAQQHLVSDRNASSCRPAGFRELTPRAHRPRSMARARAFAGHQQTRNAASPTARRGRATGRHFDLRDRIEIAGPSRDRGLPELFSIPHVAVESLVQHRLLLGQVERYRRRFRRSR